MFSLKSIIFGALSGFINSLFGAGGGILTVPYLKSRGLSQKSAQASALAVLLPVSVINTVIYYLNGYFSISDGICFVPFGFLGALTGVFIVNKIPNRILNLIFSIFLLYTGIRFIL